MGKKKRQEREEKRESFASQRSKAKRKNILMAAGVLGVVAVIVGFAAYNFATSMQMSSPGGPPGAGPLGGEHVHAAILTKIFTDEFDFSLPAYQIKNSYIHFEGQDGTTIHRHAANVNLGYLFETLNIGLDDKCYIFPDGREFCDNEEYTLKFYINHQQVPDIRDYVIEEGDRILIVYGNETPEEIENYLAQLDRQVIVR